MIQVLEKIQKLNFCIVGLLLTLVLSSCVTDDSNNYLRIEDLNDHLVNQGIKVEQVQPLEPRLIRASRAFAITIKGKEIGVYKYDTSIKKQREKLARIKETGEVYVLAIKFAAVVKGSFVLIGVGRNPEKDKIMAALKSFK
jgi:hypothetical protein